MEKPMPVLAPLTPETQESIQADVVVISTLPFRVGRESRQSFGLWPSLKERRRTSSTLNNELYMIDEGDRFYVSREHFQIEQCADGSYLLVDRGSACGTIVEGKVVGGEDAGGSCPIKHGDVIIVGKARSPYVFKFIIPDEQD